MASIENGVGDDGLPRSGREHRFKVDVAALALAEPDGLAGGHDVEPAEDRVRARAAPEQDRPGVLAGVLDELARSVDGVGDGAMQIAVVAAVELVFVAARPRPLLSSVRGVRSGAA